MTPTYAEITPDLVDRLRRIGADEDAIAFADRHVTRFSQADIDRAQTRAVLWTLGVEGLIFVVAALLGVIR